MVWPRAQPSVASERIRIGWDLPLDTSANIDTLNRALAGSYTVEREVGRGGMATVYAARDVKHGRRVALKVLRSDLAASLGADRFRREITLAASLQHPHIVAVYDSGEAASGMLWFTMPVIEGQSLRDRMRRQRQLPIDDALRVTREVALALDYAHRHGVIHRDPSLGATTQRRALRTIDRAAADVTDQVAARDLRPMKPR